MRKSWSCPLQCAMRDLTATAKAKGCKQVRRAVLQRDCDGMESQ